MATRDTEPTLPRGVVQSQGTCSSAHIPLSHTVNTNVQTTVKRRSATVIRRIKHDQKVTIKIVS